MISRRLCIWLLVAPAVVARAAGAQRAQLTGHVYDSLSRRPLAGATVQLVGARTRASYVASTDSAGAYRVDSLRPDRYQAGFFHAELDSLGVASPTRTIDVTDGA